LKGLYRRAELRPSVPDVLGGHQHAGWLPVGLQNTVFEFVLLSRVIATRQLRQRLEDAENHMVMAVVIQGRLAQADLHGLIDRATASVFLRWSSSSWDRNLDGDCPFGLCSALA